jgi:DNA-binding response OmpR family regulator
MAINVLVVDDDPTFVEMLAFALNLGGYTARTAYEARHALEIIQHNPIDLVVLDVMLPDMDGFEICRRLRADPRTRHIPVLMLSARTQVADKLSGFDAGADDYVAKPVSPKEIIARIHALLARSERARVDLAATIAFAGSKGGVGTTTLAVNVGLALVAQQRRTILVELGGLGLSGAPLLGLSLAQTLPDLLAREGFQLSLTMLQPCILPHSSGLHYLPAHAHAVGLPNYRPWFLAELIALLQSHYDCVLLDVSASALAQSVEAFLYAHLIVPLGEHERTAFWHLRPLLDWLRQNKLETKVPGLVLVQKVEERSFEAAPTLAGQLGLPLLAIIPAAGALLYEASDRQEPLLRLAPQSALALAYGEVAAKLMTRLGR